MYPRIVRDYVSKRIHSQFGILVLGPRQTGKSTLLEDIVAATEAQSTLIYRLNETATYEQIIRDPSPHRYGGSLEELLTYGSLPGICDLQEDLRREILRAYASTYLQEEIRAEALTRNLGGFSQVLEYAAIDSGTVVNFSSVSKEIGVSISTVRSYFDLLYDTLILLRVPAFTRNARKRIIRSAKYLFFDTGIRNACASLHLDPSSLLKTQAGTLCRAMEHDIAACATDCVASSCG